MTLLIIPDIFGRTPALEELAKDLTPALEQIPKPPGLTGQTPDIFDPYGDGCWFDNEDRAYAYFTRHLGIAAYAGLIRRYVAENPGPRLVLAFSAGASAVWHLAGTGHVTGISGAVCVYGSQIRHSPDLVPKFAIHLIFPESEPHFCVEALMAVLTEKPRTTCETVAGRHGFMNRYSKNFDRELYDRFVQEDFWASAFRF